MKAKLERIEVESAVASDYDFAVENRLSRQLRFDRINQLRKIPAQWFRIAALNEYFIVLAKNQRAKAIPLRLEYPVASRREFADSFRQHRQDRRGFLGGAAYISLLRG